MNLDSKIYIAGHTGMVGSAINRKLQSLGYTRILGQTSFELDLRSQEQTFSFMERERPEYVFLAAAKVGGIMANNIFRAEFLYDNLMIEANVIHAAFLANTTKLLFLGSSCIYPRNATQPLKEEYLLTGELEATNEPYAVAKIAGIKLCDAYRSQYGCNFISVMPTNLYGPNDSYDLERSHVIPALIRKFHEAKKNNSPNVTLWGTGTPMREFMHVDDLADACVFLMKQYDSAGPINVGTGIETSILELAYLIKGIVGYNGHIIHDTSKPDGTSRKLMSSERIYELGWKAGISLEEGLTQTYHGLRHMDWL